MANETERDIEKQLRAYARRRREESGAPHELHPATRRLLQGEVARAHFARGVGSARPRRFWNLRMQWITGLAAACVIALLAVVLPSMLGTRNKQSSTMELAKNDESFSNRSAGRELKQTELSDKPAAAPVPAPSGPTFAETESRSASPAASTSRAMKEEPAADSAQPSPTGLPQQTMVPLDRSGVASLAAGAQAKAPQTANPAAAEVTNNLLAENERTRGLAAGGGLAGARVATPANPPPPSPVMDKVKGSDQSADSFSQSAALTTKDFGPTNVQQFAADSETLEKQTVSGKQATASILSSFRLEETGDQLRIIDSDGSVYSGAMENSTTRARRISLAAGNSPAAVSRDAAGAPGVAPAFRSSVASNEARSGVAVTSPVYFRLTGTNLTLGKYVVITGDLISTNGIPSGAAQKPAAGNVNSPSAAPAISLRDVRLRGRLVFDGTNQIQIHAHPQTNAP